MARKRSRHEDLDEHGRALLTLAEEQEQLGTERGRDRAAFLRAFVGEGEVGVTDALKVRRYLRHAMLRDEALGSATAEERAELVEAETWERSNIWSRGLYPVPRPRPRGPGPFDAA